MGVQDPGRAVESWRDVMDFFDEWRDHSFWPRAQRMQRLIAQVMASPAGPRYFASSSLTCLGISTYPTYAERRVAPMVWVVPYGEGDDRDGFEFCLYDGRNRHPKERRTLRNEDGAFAILMEFLAKLDAEPGA